LRAIVIGAGGNVLGRRSDARTVRHEFARQRHPLLPDLQDNASAPFVRCTVSSACVVLSSAASRSAGAASPRFSEAILAD